MNRWNYAFAAAIAAFLLNLGSADAKKPDNPGGGGDPEPSGPVVVQLASLSGNVTDINEAVDGNVEAVGNVQGQAMYWCVDTGGNVQEQALSISSPSGHVANGMVAYAINNFSTIVGAGIEFSLDDTETIPYFQWPVLWAHPEADAVLLPVDDGYSGRATSINDNGIVVGVTWKDSSYSVTAWKVQVDLEADPQVTVQDWITFLPGTWVEGYLPNEPNPNIAQSGVCVTTAYHYQSEQDWGFDGLRFQLNDDDEQGLSYDLVQPLFVEPPFFSEPLDVNDDGAVAGYIQDFPSGTEAFVLDKDGNPVVLETLPPGRIKGVPLEYRNIRARAINNLGATVGAYFALVANNKYSNGSVYGKYQAMWDASGNLTLLPDDWAYSAEINDAGWIGGSFRVRDLQIRVPAVLIP